VTADDPGKSTPSGVPQGLLTRESRLLFTRSFPDDPELKRLVTAFEAGDFATVRSDAPKLVERTDNAEVKKAALDLRRRIEPDPLQLYLLGLTLLLLVFLTAWFYLHKH
jgi:hypothetical protein